MLLMFCITHFQADAVLLRKNEQRQENGQLLTILAIKE